MASSSSNYSDSSDNEGRDELAFIGEHMEYEDEEFFDDPKEEIAALKRKISKLEEEVSSITSERDRYKALYEQSQAEKEENIRALKVAAKSAATNCGSKRKEIEFSAGTPEYALSRRFPNLHKEVSVILSKNDPNNPTIAYGRALSKEDLLGLSHLLHDNKMICTSLNLRSNEFRLDDVETLVSALESNTTVEILDISYNNIGDEGALVVSKWLKQNERLISLDLASNGIGVKGATHIAVALAENSALTELFLNKNAIEIAGAQSIDDALKKNTTLLSLKIDSIYVDEKFTMVFKVSKRKLSNGVMFQSGDRELGTVCLASIYDVISSSQPASEYLSLAAAEHNLYVVEKPCRYANLPLNRSKNRYMNIVPYDDCVIILRDSTYVNASRISGIDEDGAFITTAYIATQGPLESTADDFYRMILEYKVRFIVMVTGVVENQQTKCCRYWPPCNNSFQETSAGKLEPFRLGDKEDGGSFFRDEDYFSLSLSRTASRRDCLRLENVSVQHSKEVIRGQVIERTLDIWYNSDTERRDVHRVIQYQFKGWPDHGVPKDAKDIRQIVHMIENIRSADSSYLRCPIVVHCSAGVGRTGTFIAIHQNIMQMTRALKQGLSDPKDYCFNLYQDVLRMRGCRSGMVQQPAQYTLCYKAIAEEACELHLLKVTSTSRFFPDEDEDGDDDDDDMGDRNHSDQPVHSPLVSFPPFSEHPRRQLAESTRCLSESADDDEMDDDFRGTHRNAHDLSLSRARYW